MIHPSSDYSPEPQARLWDDHDVKCLALMVEALHKYDALAGVELAHNGVGSQNHYSRLKPLGPTHQAGIRGVPTQPRAMDKADIREFRRWHRNAGLRAKQADADIVYVYAGHDSTLLMHFLQRQRNQRSDEYGGSLENRVRLFREVLEETKEAVGDRCAVAVRLLVDELKGVDGITCDEEGREIVEMLAELPDLWDVNVSDWSNDSMTSRFSEEGFQESYIAFVKGLTSKPVVGVGRFTSPDTMVSQLRRGVLDMIGAARPSIADPFLPKKIEEGRIDEIRECIGCNICVAGQHAYTPMRCTQNPTVGEEWRRAWHPERIAPKGSDDTVLVVGAGPAGLEAARALGQRGYEVHLAEARTELGGRVTQESGLPGLSAWARVRDWRVGRIREMTNVEVYLDSELTPEGILEFGFKRVLLATGARWRKDGVGVSNARPVPGSDQDRVFTPEDVFMGAELAGPVLVFDDDSFYLGGVIAEELCRRGLEVTLVTTTAQVSAWTAETLEGAAPHPGPGAGARHRGRHRAQSRAHRWRGGRAGLHLHGPPPARPGGVRGHGHLTPAERRALPCLDRGSRRARRGGHPIGPGDRRLRCALDHRGGGLRRPSGGARTRCAPGRPGHALPPRTGRARRIGLAKALGAMSCFR
jgi:dimethylamine/trimethylamine dehydrogenase